MRSQQWMKDASCYGVDDYDELFFSDLDTGEYAWAREALAFCMQCPVKDQCFDELVFTGSSDGIWAGLFSKQAKPWIEEHRTADPHKMFGDIAGTVADLLLEDALL